MAASLWRCVAEGGFEVRAVGAHRSRWLICREGASCLWSREPSDAMHPWWRGGVTGMAVREESVGLCQGLQSAVG